MNELPIDSDEYNADWIRELSKKLDNQEADKLPSSKYNDGSQSQKSSMPVEKHE